MSHRLICAWSTQPTMKRRTATSALSLCRRGRGGGAGRTSPPWCSIPIRGSAGMLHVDLHLHPGGRTHPSDSILTLSHARPVQGDVTILSGHSASVGYTSLLPFVSFHISKWSCSIVLTTCSLAVFHAPVGAHKYSASSLKRKGDIERAWTDSSRPHSSTLA